jgi:glucose-6-phosphate isomerase
MNGSFREYMDPFSLSLDSKAGTLDPFSNKIVRKYTDMKDFYQTSIQENPIIYEVYAQETPPNTGELSMATTILHPGTIGDEYFMTKGHFHRKKEASEVYIGISGRGLIIMEKEDGRTVHESVHPDILVYVPPNWAHRAVNTGDENFIFLAIYPSDAGHDYGAIEEKGFSLRVIRENGGPVIQKNDQ